MQTALIHRRSSPFDNFRIKKNVIIFGAAMSCMEKCCRADIAFQLMDRMKMEGVAPNVHIFNSAISACARCNLWSKGLELFEEMETVGVIHDVVSFNAVLDAVSSQVHLGRRLFELGIEKGFYARVSRLGTQWLELDLHFLSLGGGEIALGWWFEECLVPYLVNTSKLAAVTSIDIVTGYGKTRMRGIRHGDDGMRKRVRAMLEFMGISEIDQPNKGRIHIDKEALIREVQKNGGKILFDYEGYNRFKEQNTTANHTPDVIQQVRPRYSGPLPIQVDRRPPVNQLDGHDRRRSFDNPRRESSHTHRGPVKPNLDSTPTSSFHSVSAASSYGDRHGRRGVNGSSNQRRGSFDGYGSHSSDRNTEQQAQLKYGENEHLSSGHSLNHGSHVNSQSSDYDRRNATDWHHGLSHRRSHKDSHDQHVGARREWQQQHQNQTRNSSPYPGKDQRSGNTINIGERQFIQENQEVSYPHDAYHDNRSGVLLSRRWERANSVAQYEDNANSHFDTKTEQNTYPDHSERGNRPQNHHEQPGTDRSHVSQVPNETNLDYKTERRRGSQHLGMYRKHDEPRNSGHREGDMRNRHYTNHEDGHDWRHQSHVVDGYGGRGHQKNSRNDFERWDNQPNDFYSERRSSQAPSHGSGWEASHNREHGNYSTNKANVSQRETGEFLSQDERKVANFQDEKLDSSVGGKRPFDGGERPAAKRRGYDINPSTSFVQGSRGY
jgi:pentatricopeptide repeat protein